MEFLYGLLVGGFLGCVGMALLAGGAALRGERAEERVADLDELLGPPKTLKQAVVRDSHEPLHSPAHTVHYLRNVLTVSNLRSESLTTFGERSGILEHKNCELSGCEVCENA